MTVYGLIVCSASPSNVASFVSVHQILGFDILLMKNLKPVLLEVNSNPSMRIEHEQEVSVGQCADMNVSTCVDE